MKQVGFIGLGMMGWPMALNVARAGFPLTVYDADPERAAAFGGEVEAVAAGGPADFGECDVVVTMLPDDTVVRAAVLDWEGGLGPHLPKRAVVVDMSSSNPAGTKATAAALAEHAIDMIDAPVSGGVTRAGDGSLTLMIGGEEGPIEKARPVLEVLGAKLFRTGAIGSGHATKALNNFVGGTTYAVTVEALAVGKQLGLDPQVMIDVMNVSTGRSFNTQVVVDEHVLTGAYRTDFALALLAKDVANAARIASDAGVDAPFSRLSAERWAAARERLGPTADHSEAHKAWWDAALARG